MNDDITVRRQATARSEASKPAALYPSHFFRKLDAAESKGRRCAPFGSDDARHHQKEGFVFKPIVGEPAVEVRV